VEQKAPLERERACSRTPGVGRTQIESVEELKSGLAYNGLGSAHSMVSNYVSAVSCGRSAQSSCGTSTGTATKPSGHKMSKHLFISYSSKDREFVSRLATDLRSLGIYVWWDRWEMRVGDSLNRKIQEGIAQAGWLAIVLSRQSVKSPWVERELNAAMVRELETKEVFVLPLLIDDCDLPIFLRDKLYADFRESFEDGLAALVESVAPRIEPARCIELMSEEAERIRAALLKVPEENRPTYIQWLVGKLGSEESRDRLAALMALHVLGYERLVPHLIGLAKDLSPSTRRLAAFYLGELRAAAGLAILNELTQDASSMVRVAARDALQKIRK